MRTVLATAVLVVGASAARAGFPPDASPVFSQPLYSVTVDVSPPGLETFSFSGTVSDADVGDVVTVFNNADAIFRLSTTPGNPATFTFSSIGLGYRNLGVAQGFFTAFDDASPPRVGSAAWRVTIVPEPIAAATLVGAAVILSRRRCLTGRMPSC